MVSLSSDWLYRWSLRLLAVVCRWKAKQRNATVAQQASCLAYCCRSGFCRWRCSVTSERKRNKRVTTARAAVLSVGCMASVSFFSRNIRRHSTFTFTPMLILKTTETSGRKPGKISCERTWSERTGCCYCWPSYSFQATAIIAVVAPAGAAV